MPLLLPALVLASSLTIPVADRAPDLNINPSCNGAAQSGVTVNRDKNDCLREEREAHSQLDKDWAQYPGGDRTRCTQSTVMGGVPSYVELLTCLEIAKSARELPEDDLNDPAVGRGSAQ